MTLQYFGVRNWARVLMLYGSSCILAGCALFSGSRPIALKKSDIRFLENLPFQVAAGAPMVSAPLEGRPLKIYTVAFDGTLNDRARINATERNTIVGHIAKKLNLDADSYYPGPGMQGSIVNPLDALTGASTKQVAEIARDRFFEWSKKLLEEEPTTEIRIVVTGFSRGAATARHFMNLVDTTWNQRFGAAGAPSQEKSPRFYAILYDTVATFQEESLLLGLPASVDYAVHFMANDEVRRGFTPIYDVDQNFWLTQTSGRTTGPAVLQSDRLTVVITPGAHSDIGTSYLTGIGGLYLSISEEILYRMGLSDTNCWDIPIDVFNYGMHDSRGVIDRILGLPAPETLPSSRSGKPKVSAAMSIPDMARLRKRVQQLMFLGAKSRGPSIRHSSKSEGPEFFVKKDKDNLEILAVNDVWVDHSSVKYVINNNQRRLNYKYTGSLSSSTFIISEAMWNRLKSDEVSSISLSFLVRKGKMVVVIFIDEIYASEIVAGQLYKSDSSKLSCTQ